MKRFFIPVVLTGLIISCSHNAIIPESAPVSFKNDVQPLIISNCTQSGCHGNTDTEEFTLLTYDDVMDHGEVTPGDAGESKLYKVITGKDKQMPPDYSMSEEQIRVIYFWISQGAKNN